MISDSTLHPTGHCEAMTFVPVNFHNSEEVLSKKVHFVEHFHPLTVALLDWLAARLKGAVDSCLRFTTHSSAGPFLGPPYRKRLRLCFGRSKGMTLPTKYLF